MYGVNAAAGCTPASDAANTTASAKTVRRLVRPIPTSSVSPEGAGWAFATNTGRRFSHGIPLEMARQCGLVRKGRRWRAAAAGRSAWRGRRRRLRDGDDLAD